MSIYISLHTFIAHILNFLEFSLSSAYKTKQEFHRNDLPSVILSSFFFNFCSSSFSENFAFVPKKYALTHNNCYYQFLFPILLFSLQRPLQVPFGPFLFLRMRNRKNSFRSLLIIFISLFNISRKIKRSIIRRQNSSLCIFE